MGITRKQEALFFLTGSC